MDKKEVFSMIWRNGHSRSKAIRYISDFLQISKKEASQIYDNEYLKEHPVQNGSYRRQNVPETSKAPGEYKEAFTYKYSLRGILDEFRGVSNEY